MRRSFAHPRPGEWRVVFAGAPPIILLWLLWVIAWFLLAHPVRAESDVLEDATGKGPSPFAWGASETWTGGDASRNGRALYSGATWAPFGLLQDQGWRVRLSGGYGEYRYRSVISGEPQSVYGTVAFADLLAGYQFNLGPVTIKAFAGATFDGHVLAPFDETNPVNDLAAGAKGVLEGWWNVTPALWLSFDLSGATAHKAHGTRVRVGYRVIPDVSLGVEGGIFGNEASDTKRAGGFARYEWGGGEISASGGVSGDYNAKPRTPYATLVYLSRF